MYRKKNCSYLDKAVLPRIEREGCFDIKEEIKSEDEEETRGLYAG